VFIYEATISTVKDSPQAAAWVFEPQLKEERARDPAQSPPRGPEAFDAGLKARRMAGEASKRLRFGRAAHVKQGRDFARIRTKGERVALGSIVANWLQLPAGSPSRLGVITSGKLGGAVVRSRIRRLLRESYRLHQFNLACPVDLVLVARPSIVGKDFQSVEKDFLTTLRKAKLLKDNAG
jgi:ribonuclease P protein component